LRDWITGIVINKLKSTKNVLAKTTLVVSVKENITVWMTESLIAMTIGLNARDFHSNFNHTKQRCISSKVKSK
jgi:hypothetical protein